MTRSARFALSAVIAGAILAQACGRSESYGRVILLGLAGADPATIDLLMSEGKLPHFAS